MSLLRSGILISALLFMAMLPANAQVSFQGGAPTLTIDTGIAGGQPLPVVNVSARLRFSQQKNDITKLTVETSCPGQRFLLSVMAISPDAGIAAPEVTLTNGMLPVDFITDIPTGNRAQRATLQYTASATFAQGNSTELGNDLHTVTYTLVVQ